MVRRYVLGKQLNCGERHLVTNTLVLRSYNAYCDAELDIILDIDISNASSSEFGNNHCPYNHLSACFNGCRLAHGILCYGHWYLGKIHKKLPEIDRSLKWTIFKMSLCMAYVFAAVVEYAVANFIKKPEIDRLARRVFPISFSLLRKVFILPWFMNYRVSI